MTLVRTALACFVAYGLLLAAVRSGGDPLLPAMYQDHGVLQRDRPIVLRGRVAPDESLTLKFAGTTVDTRADHEGRWSASLPPMAAGGPHELVVSTGSGRRQVVRDLLVGEVFLCSGQSNMVLQVKRAHDSRAEIAGADNDSIRMMTIAENSSATVLDTFATPVTWQPTTPATIPEFSAACYFHARELQKTVPVPMGLINASRGGSRIQAWISTEVLRELGGHDDALDLVARYRTDPVGALRHWTGLWEQWWLRDHRERPWREAAAGSGEWEAAPAQLGAWESWGDPRLANFDGMLWFRTRFHLDDSQAGQPARLLLGNRDEVDVTWINGVPAGTSSWAQPERHYDLPAGLLRAGENTLTLNVLDTYASGGLTSATSERRLEFGDGSVVPLDGDWQFQIVAPGASAPPRAPWDVIAGVGVAHNAMVAPIGDYAIKAVLWYQGESNTVEPAEYESLLRAWMADRRRQSGAALPVLVAQLANFGPGATQPVESGWAELREAQRLAVASDAHAALAVSIDLGDRHDLHPATKQELGRRLARASRHVVYGEPIAPSGPVPAAAWREGDSVIVAFDDVEAPLAAYSADGPIGFELCGDAAGSCRYALASLQPERVVLAAGAMPGATRVRHCWADNPVCTLHDATLLPAGPFEIAIRAPDSPPSTPTEQLP